MGKHAGYKHHEGTKIGHAEHHAIHRGVHEPQNNLSRQAKQPQGHSTGEGGHGTRIGFGEHHTISGSREPHCIGKK